MRVRGTFCFIYKTYQVLAADGGVCWGKGCFLREGKSEGSEMHLLSVYLFCICVCMYISVYLYLYTAKRKKKSISVIQKDFLAAVPPLPPSLCTSHYDIFRK